MLGDTNRLSLIKFVSPDRKELVMAIAACLAKKDPFAAEPRMLPLQVLLDHVFDQGAECAILQRDVQDPDFLAEHAAYYARWSGNVERYCYRFHFFCSTPSSDDALEVIDEFAMTPSSYLGFLTLRPVRMSPVGVSILRRPSQAKGKFVLAAHDFPVNLAGKSFIVNGTPFMQQDNAVGACAQASIWMALRTMRHKEGHSAFSPAEITTAATRFLVQGRTLPNRNGLTIEQMTEAIRAAGYAPHLLRFGPVLNEDGTASAREPARIRRVLYPYVESGIPVVLALEKASHNIGHAVLVIGHGWNATASTTPLPDDAKMPGRLIATDASQWTEPLIVHNDAGGPYQQIFDGPDPNNWVIADAVFALPLLPPDVFMDGEEAQTAALQHLRAVLPDSGSTGGNNTQPVQVVVRTYLQDRSMFRKNVDHGGMSTELKRYYRSKWLPRRVWVVEINEVASYPASASGAGRSLGEILIDPTSELEDGRFLSIHVSAALLGLPPGAAGVLIDRDTKTDQMTAGAIPDATYCPLRRA